MGRPPRWGLLLHPGISTHTELLGRGSEGRGSAPQDNPRGEEDEEKHEALPPSSERSWSQAPRASLLQWGWELKGEKAFSTKERQAVRGQHPPARNPHSTNQRRFHLTSRLGYQCISQRAPHSCFMTNHPEPRRPSGRRGSSSSRAPEVLFRAGFALGWSSQQDTLFTLRIVGRPRAHLMPGSTAVLTSHRPAKPHSQARGPRESRGRLSGERQVLRSCWAR